MKAIILISEASLPLAKTLQRELPDTLIYTKNECEGCISITSCHRFIEEHFNDFDSIIFIGAMAGLVYSSTLAGQLLFFEITGGCSWALISYYQTPKAQAACVFENTLSRTRFMLTGRLTVVGFGISVLAFVFYFTGL